MSHIDHILDQIDDGDPSAANQLLRSVYAELRQLAAARMSNERTGHTLTPTALVHEAYLRLVKQPSQKWSDRGHFFSAAAEAMRRILIDHARKRGTAKRGCDAKRVDLDAIDLFDPSRGPGLIALDEALDRLEQADAEAAQVVKLRFFAGLTNQQVAQHLGISPRKANMRWAYARAWVRRSIEDGKA